MAKPNRLKELEAKHGKPLEEVILPLVNELGQKKAASKLGIAASTVCEWLKDNHYIPKVSYVKVQPC